MNIQATNSNSLPPVNKSAAPRMSEPKPKIGSGGNDFAMLAEARGKLSTDKELINKVVVEIKDGNATLTGKVASDNQKKNAESLIGKVEGLKSIKNNLVVSP